MNADLRMFGFRIVVTPIGQSPPRSETVLELDFVAGIRNRPFCVAFPPKSIKFRSQPAIGSLVGVFCQAFDEWLASHRCCQCMLFAPALKVLAADNFLFRFGIVFRECTEGPQISRDVTAAKVGSNRLRARIP